MLSPQELERYARHIVLREVGGPGQAALKRARVLVVGAGGLGAPVLLYLAAAGVGTLGIVDDDEVSLSNLQRQVIHGTPQVGTPKVESAAATIHRINPHVAVEPHATRLLASNALDLIGRSERGALIYLRQEGRGIGLGNKIRAYALQARGADTYEANRALGFVDDLRRYDVAARMLEYLGPQSIDLITNNPLKIKGLEAEGVRVRRRIPSLAASNPHNVGYLKTKRERSGHLIELAEQKTSA